MKYSILILLALFSFNTIAQETCDYKINVETDEEIFKLTHESIIDYVVRPDKTIFIYFSLMKEDNVKSVVLHLSLNSTETPPIVCFNEKGKIAFKLESGEFVSAPYLGEETCGRQTQGEESMNNSTSEASFYLDEIALKRLSNSKIESMRIFSARSNFDLELREVIYNDNLAVPIYPKDFFIDNLKCID
jgi:hypothetical protein